MKVFEHGGFESVLVRDRHENPRKFSSTRKGKVKGKWMVACKRRKKSMGN